MIEWFFIKISIIINVIIICVLFVLILNFANPSNKNVAIYYVNNNLKKYHVLILSIVYFYIIYKSYVFFKKYNIQQQSDIIVKILGNQWYWEIKYLNENIKLEGPMITLPTNKQISFLVSSQDVIHGLFIPDLRINIEGIKGKINEQKFIVKQPGKYYGECNVLCGINHTKMPIVLNFISHKKYSKWILHKIKY